MCYLNDGAESVNLAHQRGCVITSWHLQVQCVGSGVQLATSGHVGASAQQFRCSSGRSACYPAVRISAVADVDRGGRGSFDSDHLENHVMDDGAGRDVQHSHGVQVGGHVTTGCVVGACQDWPSRGASVVTARAVSNNGAVGVCSECSCHIIS